MSAEAAYASPLILMSRIASPTATANKPSTDYDTNVAAKEEIETILKESRPPGAGEMDKILMLLQEAGVS